VITARRNDESLLRSIKTGEKSSPLAVFSAEVSSRPEFFEDVGANQHGKPIRFTVRYPNDGDHYVVDTDHGPVRVQAIRFEGELSLKTKEVPVGHLTEYANTRDGNPISQSAAFEFQACDRNLSLEMHKIVETGETHLVLRSAERKNV
jgi:hypothetical protein